MYTLYRYLVNGKPTLSPCIPALIGEIAFDYLTEEEWISFHRLAEGSDTPGSERAKELIQIQNRIDEWISNGMLLCKEPITYGQIESAIECTHEDLLKSLTDAQKDRIGEWNEVLEEISNCSIARDQTEYDQIIEEIDQMLKKIETKN